jgi:hypothetical protein
MGLEKVTYPFGSIIGSRRSTSLGDKGCKVQKHVKSTIMQLFVLLSANKSSQRSTGNPSISTGSRRDKLAQQFRSSSDSSRKTDVVKKLPRLVQPQASNWHLPFERIIGIVSKPSFSHINRKPSNDNFFCSSNSCLISSQIQCFSFIFFITPLAFNSKISNVVISYLAPSPDKITC